MKIIFLSNNPISEPLIKWLSEREEVLLTQNPLTEGQVSGFQPEIIISYSYRHIIKPEILNLLPNRFINLHISFLPYNRGADPNIWSFLENTPKGVSIHLIDEGIDTGAVLLQKEVFFDERKETLTHSYQTLQQEIQDLFCTNWELLRKFGIPPKAQTTAGTFHKSSEFLAIKDKLLGKESWDVPIPLLRERFRILQESINS